MCLNCSFFPYGWHRMVIEQLEKKRLFIKVDRQNSIPLNQKLQLCNQFSCSISHTDDPQNTDCLSYWATSHSKNALARIGRKSPMWNNVQCDDKEKQWLDCNITELKKTGAHCTQPHKKCTINIPKILIYLKVDTEGSVTLKHLSSLLESETLSDVEFDVQGKVTRLPVMAAIFQLIEDEIIIF